MPPDPWPLSTFATVAENACENCHRQHSGLTNQWILTSPFEEDVCLVCHNAHVAPKNIQSDMNKVFHHPVELTTDVHNPKEDPSLPMTKHVECTDCHNAHRVRNARLSSAPNVSEGMRYVDGVDTNGSYVDEVRYDYEVCYKCHADFPMSDPAVTREVTEPSMRLQFDPGNPSYHPIEGPGQNHNVPSLIGGLSESSIIYCTDCHASNTGPGNSGSGPAGPHGSDYEFILERNYSMVDNAAETSTRYAMCYKCHSRSSILNDQSFRGHEKHIVGEQTPCSICHDPHGVLATDGKDHTHLINFDLSVVRPEPSSGRLEYIDYGNSSGECWLDCHGKPHDGFKY